MYGDLFKIVRSSAVVCQYYNRTLCVQLSVTCLETANSRMTKEKVSGPSKLRERD